MSTTDTTHSDLHEDVLATLRHAPANSTDLAYWLGHRGWGPDTYRHLRRILRELYRSDQVRWNAQTKTYELVCGGGAS